MSNIVPIQDNKSAVPGSMHFNAKELTVIKSNSCPSYISNFEFEQFIHICQQAGLNPLMKQVYCFVFSPKDPKKRNMTVVTSIHGLTAIANRTGCYRPFDQRTEFTYGEKCPQSNPFGLESAYTGCYVFRQGAWHFSPGEAYWDEYAPIITEKWEHGSYQQCDPHLDPKKAAWRKMGRIMLEKCALAKAIRKAFPEDCSSLFSEDEMAKAETLELTATEVIEKRQETKRQEALGGPVLMVDWLDGKGLTTVKIAEFHGKAMDFIKRHQGEERLTILAWRDHNRETLRQFWGFKKEEALSIKAELEKLEGK